MGGSNGIKFLIFQVTPSECIIGSFDQKLSKFLLLGTDPLKVVKFAPSFKIWPFLNILYRHIKQTTDLELS